MLNKALLKPEVSKFIKENQNKDIPALILKGSPFEDVSIQEIAVQIKGLQIAKKKFPAFYNTEDILYPPKLNLEQTSSEITARYKASLIKGNTGIDITGGLGIDSYFLSRNFKNFIYCEINKELAEIASHNFQILNAENIRVEQGNGIEFLKKQRENFDWIYSDPARRDDSGGKVFKLEDCEPNLPENLDFLFQKSDNILIKTSPILDISAGINELKSVRKIHIVAVRNEVKELLWILKKDFKGTSEIECINFEKNQIQKFSGNVNAEETASLANPEKFLFEPNAAIMKSGLYNLLAVRTSTKKLHPHSHLYTSDKIIDFPGRKFQIIEFEEYRSLHLKKKLKSIKANITTRNFPESVEQIRKKFKIKEGGVDYIFFTTNPDGKKIVIFCKKV